MDYEPCVLVTYDNKMPFVHAAELKHFGTTLAVVNRRSLENWSGAEDHFVRNVVHRWLHRYEIQDAGAQVAYGVGVASL